MKRLKRGDTDHLRPDQLCIWLEEHVGIRVAVEEANCNRLFPLQSCVTQRLNHDRALDDYNRWRSDIRSIYFSVADLDIRVALMEARHRSEAIQRDRDLQHLSGAIKEAMKARAGVPLPTRLAVYGCGWMAMAASGRLWGSIGLLTMTGLSFCCAQWLMLRLQDRKTRRFQSMHTRIDALRARQLALTHLPALFSWEERRTGMPQQELRDGATIRYVPP